VCVQTASQNKDPDKRRSIPSSDDLSSFLWSIYRLFFKDDYKELKQELNLFCFELFGVSGIPFSRQKKLQF
jgi:hypothetical protein